MYMLKKMSFAHGILFLELKEKNRINAHFAHK